MASVNVTLSLNTTARINRALESIDIVGERYPKHLLSRVGKSVNPPVMLRVAG